MIKPNNFENVQSLGGYTPLELGGHVLIIKKVEETKSGNGKDMLKITLDTHSTDKQPGYYSEQWKNDTRNPKKWGCMVHQIVLDTNNNTSRGFKTFIDSVEKSNNGFSVQWGENFCNSLKDKVVGGIFGREEYQEGKFVTRCQLFATVDRVKSGDITAPKDKLLSGSYNNDGDLTVVNDGDMPF